MEHVEAKITSPNTPKPRVACYRHNPDGKTQGVCAACGKKVGCDGVASYEEVHELACNGKCAHEAGFYPIMKPFVAPTVRVKRKKGEADTDESIIPNAPKEVYCGGGNEEIPDDEPAGDDPPVSEIVSSTVVDVDIPDPPKVAPEPKPVKVSKAKAKKLSRLEQMKAMMDEKGYTNET